jgi:hypothetical protein
MKNQNAYKPPVVLNVVSSYQKTFATYAGFFSELETCATIEEALKSFDDLAEERKIKSRKSFQYKG